MKDDDIKHLANLAKIELTDEEISMYVKDIPDILKFVDQLQEVDVEDDNGKVESALVRNVFREDENPHESGLYTEDLLKEAPKSRDGYVEVKKVLNTDGAGA